MQYTTERSLRPRYPGVCTTLYPKSPLYHVDARRHEGKIYSNALSRATGSRSVSKNLMIFQG